MRSSGGTEDRRPGTTFLGSTPGRRWFAAGLLLVLWPLVGLALDPNTAVTQLVHAQWTTTQGLPQGTIGAIAQTPDGYLWLGTQEGLVRFDGVRFTVFDSVTTPLMGSNYITTLLVDKEGTLWGGTNAGRLLYLKDGAFGVFTKDDGLCDAAIYELGQDCSGHLLVRTGCAGLYRLVGARFEQVTTGKGFTGDKVSSILCDRRGSFWLGTVTGALGRSCDGSPSCIEQVASLQDTVKVILGGQDEECWIGTYGSGLYRLKDQALTGYRQEDGLAGDKVKTLLMDRDGNLWIGTTKGLCRWHQGRFQIFGKREGLSNDQVLSLFEDKEGDLWVGTLYGLNRLSEPKVQTVATHAEPSSDVVLSVLEDASGRIWAGGFGGLTILNGNHFDQLGEKGQWDTAPVMTLSNDRKGALWVGTLGNGMVEIKDGSVKRWTREEGISSDFVMALHADSLGALWIGTNRGLDRLSDGVITPVRLSGESKSDAITMLAETHDGALWVGRNGGDLVRILEGRISYQKLHGEGLARVPLSLLEDKKGRIWIGTKGGGLYRLQNGVLSHCTRRDGLFADTIFALLEDDLGRLWMSSNSGIFYAGLAEIEDLFEGRRKRITCASFGVSDGMRTSECSGGGSPAGYRARDGRLLFPTMVGVVSIDPSHIPKNPTPPPVIIEEIRADGALLPREAPAALQSGLRRIEIRYTAPSLQSPGRVQFKVRLEGFEGDWVDVGDQREVSYTNLRPGRYRFRVIACNHDDVWNLEGAAWSFVVNPHYYQTWWFYTLMGLLVAALLWGTHRVRMRWLETRNLVLTERNRIAREVHDTVSQGLSGVVLRLETAESVSASNPEGALEHVSQAKELARECMESTRRAIHALRPQLLETSSFPEALRLLGETMTQGTDVALAMKVRGRPRFLPGEEETDLWRIAQESLANAVRHGRPRAVRIELGYGISRWSLSIKDDGAGFTLPTSGTHGAGMGLTGMKERATARGWELAIKSRPGHGTEIRVVGKTNRPDEEKA